MKKLNLENLEKYVSENIGSFHAARLNALSMLELKKILLHKNPYLFKAKNVLTSEALVKQLLDAYLSSQEETMFGEFLEGLAIFIAGKAFNGKKSAAEGVDLEFTKSGVKYICAIKSGPNWGNSSQIARMIDNFKKAKRILKTNSSKTNIIAVNGCCYGRENKPDKGDYLKYCGQKFWEFISGDAKQYAKIINKFTTQFSSEFCHNGAINWKKLVEFNSRNI
jgi:hypothetical protein